MTSVQGAACPQESLGVPGGSFMAAAASVFLFLNAVQKYFPSPESGKMFFSFLECGKCAVLQQNSYFYFLFVIVGPD